MVLSATVVGALLGLGTQMYSNALRKLPYMRHPWEHVLGMGLGAVFVNQLVKWDAQLQQDLDKMLQKAKEANERRYFGRGGKKRCVCLCGDVGDKGKLFHKWICRDRGKKGERTYGIRGSWKTYKKRMKEIKESSGLVIFEESKRKTDAGCCYNLRLHDSKFLYLEHANMMELATSIARLIQRNGL
ncbi:unnamed protein product [Dovyalis caffra]|uniref:Uncharacterized protein n=1 Tax=Dovyalis caffra TaxID=77055 RepID=A0AAV1RGR6_9ROSI|nr:unnamed protein product [Dovyalis caffra]